LHGWRFRSALEISCGNGALARHLAPLCDAYTGLDASDRALAGARLAVPQARFVQGYIPCDLPGTDHDLVVLSEFLYVLDPAGIAALASQIAARWPKTLLLCVTLAGQTGHALQGDAALDHFRAAMTATHSFAEIARTADYRSDRATAGRHHD